MTSDPPSESLGNGGFTVMTEAGFAAMRVEEGATVVEREGRFWGQTFSGFFQPIHQLAKFAESEIARPTWKCWGYRAALVPEAAGAANGSIPVHLMMNSGQFTERMLEESRRRDLRRCRREVEIRRIDDPQPFMDGGWGVYQSAKERTGHGGAWSEPEFLRQMRSRAVDPRRLLIGGFIKGRLGGYMESYAVDGILYGRDLYVASDVARTGIATGLYVETFAIAARMSDVHQVCLGPVYREKPGLGWFKEGLGVPAVRVPASIHIPGPVAAFIRLRRPAVYYRLTGTKDPSPASLRRGSSERPRT